MQHPIAGILLLVAGIAFPLGMVAWLNGRLNRQPRPTPREIGLILSLNGLLPLGLVMLGLGLMMPQLWEALWLRVTAAAAWIGAGGALIALIVSGRSRPTGGRNGR